MRLHVGRPSGIQLQMMAKENAFRTLTTSKGKGSKGTGVRKKNLKFFSSEWKPSVDTSSQELTTKQRPVVALAREPVQPLQSRMVVSTKRTVRSACASDSGCRCRNEPGTA